MSDPNTSNPPALMRVPAGAEMLGITTNMFYAGLVDREIPVTLIQLGRYSYVRRAELERWLRGPDPAPNAADLFT